jgi:hypothetical protein
MTAKWTFEDSLSLSEALDAFKKMYGPGEFLDQSQVHIAVKILENPEYSVAVLGHELFPGRTTLRRHDCLQILCNAPGDNGGEAFVIGATMGSTGKMSALKSFLFLWLTNLFAPKQFHFPVRARQIYYRAVKQSTALAKEKLLEDLSVFPVEDHLSDSLGALRKKLGIDLLLPR